MRCKSNILFCFLVYSNGTDYKIISGTENQDTSTRERKSTMKVTNDGIINRIIQDKYGKRGVCNELGMPTYSLPLSIKDAPEGSKSFAVVIDDKDAFPVSGGFTWVH